MEDLVVALVLLEIRAVPSAGAPTWWWSALTAEAASNASSWAVSPTTWCAMHSARSKSRDLRSRNAS
jgi:hypothetical protein